MDGERLHEAEMRAQIRVMWHTSRNKQTVLIKFYFSQIKNNAILSRDSPEVKEIYNNVRDCIL